MPIDMKEVVRVLRDERLSKISFSVGPITVDAEGYRNVAAYIEAKDIKVVVGHEPIAFYDGHRNTITTPAGNPPLDSGDAAQLLHECTHAIVDIDRLDVLRLDDEVAAYLAQLTYMWVVDPSPFPPAFPTARLGPLMRLTAAFAQVIKRYKLNTSEGFGARISDLDIAGLRRVVHAHPEYRDIQWGEKGKARDLGVPVSDADDDSDGKAGKAKKEPDRKPHNQMDLLRHAMGLGKRGGTRDVNIYSPSPRFDIF